MIYLFTDLDGTFIPEDNDSEIALNTFKKFINDKKMKIVYVTGRNIQETKSAIKMYNLPEPYAMVCDVGTTIYYKKAFKFIKDASYVNHLKTIVNLCKTKKIRSIFKNRNELTLQEFRKQRQFKISYYFKRGNLDLNLIKDKLKEIPWDIIVSYTNNGVGLLDIIPRNISKLSAVNWITHKFSNKDQIIFAGDSGNDMKIFESKIDSIVVKNASDEIKTKLDKKNNIYISSKKYTRGVLDGYVYYKKKRGL